MRKVKEMRRPGRVSVDAETPETMKLILKSSGKQHIPGRLDDSSQDQERVSLNRRHKTQRKETCEEDKC